MLRATQEGGREGGGGNTDCGTIETGGKLGGLVASWLVEAVGLQAAIFKLIRHFLKYFFNDVSTIRLQTSPHKNAN